MARRADRAGARAGFARPGRARRHPRARRLGEGGRGRPAQGASAEGRGRRRARVGQAHPDHARRDPGGPPRHAASCSPSWPPRAAPCGPGTGTSAPTSTSPTPKAANEAALVDLTNGVTSLWLEVAPDADLAHAARRGAARPRSRGHRRPRRPGGRGPGLPRRPGRDHARARHQPGGRGDSLVEVAGLARDAGTLGVVVDATTVHDRGASDVQELAYSLALGAAYLRELTAAGFGVDEAVRPLRVPVRRHRRAVPHHRQAPRRPPALGPGAGAERCARRRRSASTSSPAGR